MTDSEIVDLFKNRSEQAITEANEKYGRGCRKIALSVLNNPEDAEEAVNDMWLRVWNAIPPAEPENLFAFLSATVRHCAMNRSRYMKAAKRGGGIIPISLDDAEGLSDPNAAVNLAVDERMLQEAVSGFLDSLSYDARTIFVQRYANDKTVSEIAALYRISESNVKISLMRTRRKLRTYLKKEKWL